MAVMCTSKVSQSFASCSFSSKHNADVCVLCALCAKDTIGRWVAHTLLRPESLLATFLRAYIWQATQSCVTWSGEGDALSGRLQSAADIEFYVDIDEESGTEMVHVADPKPQRRQPEFLVKDISRWAPAHICIAESLMLLSICKSE